jgi:hypothetical protein
MKTPERSAALGRVLAIETDRLPKDFAAKVAALAKSNSAPWRLSGNDLGLLGAFAAMLCLCAAGWLTFGTQESARAEWFGPIVGAMASCPWLVIGVAGVALVQALNFRRRATT